MKMTESAENTQVSSAFGQRRWAAVEAMRAVEAHRQGRNPGAPAGRPCAPRRELNLSEHRRP